MLITPPAIFEPPTFTGDAAAPLALKRSRITDPPIIENLLPTRVVLVHVSTVVISAMPALDKVVLPMSPARLAGLPDQDPFSPSLMTPNLVPISEKRTAMALP